MAGKPKTPFFIVLGLVVVGLVLFAVSNSDLFAPEGKSDKPGDIDPTKVGTGQYEAPDSQGVTTVKEYEFVPASTLPPVKGVSGYKKLEETDNTVRFALNVWAGWGPIIHANGGFKAERVWRTPEGKPFKVELVLIDDPVAMRDAYANGDVHIGWATLDMVPLFMEAFVDRSGNPKDSRIMPRIFQQVDWSNGGDGIVVRGDIKTVRDLRGKRIVLAQNSPSHYFALNMLVSGGVQPSEVKWTFTSDAFQAAAAFNADKSISAAVTWAPDIYNLSDVPGNRMLVNTVTANKLIADVWFARADFAKDHGDICEALVRGIFDAMVELKTDEAKQALSKLMATGYNLPASDALGMLADAHSTNWAENYQFFVNQNNPANFERVWNQAYYLYRRIGTVKHQPVSFQKVMDFSIIKKLASDPKYSTQRDEYQVSFTPKPVTEIKAESDEILTNTVVIHFFPNSWDLNKKVMKEVNGKSVETLYDPNVDNVLEEIAKLVGQFGLSQVIIEGHTDASMKGRVQASLVKKLAENRALAVKTALVNKYKLDPSQFNVDGVGWDRPADPQDAMNHAKNRRVEIKIYAAEGN
jgi:outer membrane protein OmpA-like peptidoglycan-associated protein/ABC-type nitrate/sulfonate/bicarbonate transport system substrate-binding protein